MRALKDLCRCSRLTARESFTDAVYRTHDYNRTRLVIDDGDSRERDQRWVGSPHGLEAIDSAF